MSKRKSVRSTGEPRENLVRDEKRVSNLVSTAIFYFQKMQQNFLISANSFVQRTSSTALHPERETSAVNSRASDSCPGHTERFHPK